MVDPVQEALVARRIGSVEIGLHATPGYLARRGAPATLAEVTDFELIGYDRATPALRAMLQHFPELPRERMALATDSDVAQLAAIRAGFGIGACQVGLDGNAGLVRLLPEAFALSLPVWVVMHEDLRSSPRCRAAFDALAAGLSAQIG
jgi:DNA-binding transcriptional LysR family regulator